MIDFIKLHPRIEEAQNLNESPLATLRYTAQIQLKPFDPQPYTQITASKDLSLTFGDNYKVYIVRCRDKFEVEVTEHVRLTQLFIDGRYQIRLRIAYLRQDFGTEPVYFKIERYGIGLKHYYSNKFLVTSIKSELTARIDYVNPNNANATGLVARGTPLESIRLAFFFNNHEDQTEIDVYYQITEGQNVNPRILPKEYTEWQTQLWNAWTFKRLCRAFYAGRVYINQVRNYPIEGLEYNKREGHTNVSEMAFITDPDEKDKINIIPVIIGDDFETIPFRSSSNQKSSTNFLSSQEEITI